MLNKQACWSNRRTSLDGWDYFLMIFSNNDTGLLQHLAFLYKKFNNQLSFCFALSNPLLIHAYLGFFPNALSELFIQ